jgi:hypothetical protein
VAVVGTGATAAREHSLMRLTRTLCWQCAGNTVSKDNLLLVDANTDGAIEEITKKGTRAG